ncbi:endothelin-converting enzyme homolog [Trichonephila inaurata madagascariensis]|uniref:Endothelin-converting enzyme homolog n=1 Tax=Trichonephila inaurata madagascariensis TaxID=2747483 RepID=A0A8X6XC91_9ARAC|nr:endothelin-converting enzyme homolog [Trichonephila inaurata madagascariensis]
MDSSNRFSKANGNKDQESIIKKRNFWQRRSKMEKILLTITGIFTAHKEYCTTPACVTIAANVINFMDQSVDPCEDFYQYACGGWIKANPLPDNENDRNRYKELIKTNNHILKYILENENFTLVGEAEKKARTFYKSCMDLTRIKLRGKEPLLDLLEKSGGWTISGDFDIQDWNFQRMLEVQHNEYGSEGFFKWAVSTDLKNSTRNALSLFQPSLTLLNRDYYLNKTKHGKILDAYLSYMTKVGVILDGKEYATTALLMKDVLDFETKLAEIIPSAEEKMDPNKIYEKMTVADLQELVPFINWTHYFDSAFTQVGRKISSSEDVIIFGREYFEKLTQLINKYLYDPQGRVTLINYAAWSLLKSNMKYISQGGSPSLEVQDLNMAFFGSKGKYVRWETCVSAVVDGIPFAVSAMFIREAFKGESKAMANSMIDKIKQAFTEKLYHLEWMDPETQKRAAEKASNCRIFLRVDSLHQMTGFPDYVLYPDQVDEEYKDLEFSETDYFNNNMNVLRYDDKKNMRKLDLAPNRTEWRISATDTNAYYSAPRNHIVITAAILQPPFYDVNYPNQSILVPWGLLWAMKLLMLLIMQLNGKLTLRENLADDGGLKVAYQAYQNWVAENPKELPLPGIPLTHNQLFFLAYAQSDCSIRTPETQRFAALADTHSAPKYRVIGSLSNSEDFAREFKCRSKSAMNPQPKCEIW